jgi:UDP-N-acetylglucosamine 2-epimerase (non-hydrolysing)
MGTRPEAIKLAPVVLELRRRPDFRTRVCATGQHRELLDQALGSFDLSPDIDLGIMSYGQSLAAVTARAVEGLFAVIAHERPDVVVVQGDTTTTFCGALAASYNRVAVAQVEAGLRTPSKYAPFPEEINRRLTTRLVDYHFAPTERARQALLAEGVPDGCIHVTGNTVIDALLMTRDRIRERPPSIAHSLAERMNGRLVVLVTGHRRESFGDGFRNICLGIRDAADAVPEVLFVYPVHLNPRVQAPVGEILGTHPRVALVEPLPYQPFVWLMERSTVVLTDSGGVQEEAPALGKPVLVMRDTTERPEGVAVGNARLVGTSRERIASELISLLRDPSERARMASVNNPYGDGCASQRIADLFNDLPRGPNQAHVAVRRFVGPLARRRQ